MSGSMHLSMVVMKIFICLQILLQHEDSFSGLNEDLNEINQKVVV